MRRSKTSGPGTAPTRNAWPFFGACAGQRELLLGARSDGGIASSRLRAVEATLLALRAKIILAGKLTAPAK